MTEYDFIEAGLSGIEYGFLKRDWVIKPWPKFHPFKKFCRDGKDLTHRYWCIRDGEYFTAERIEKNK